MQRGKIALNQTPAVEVAIGPIALGEYVVRDPTTGNLIGANPPPITQAQALKLVSFRG